MKLSAESSPNFEEQDVNASIDAAERNKITFFFIMKGIKYLCRERDSNPHSHYWPRDFKSLVSTNSTIAATL